MGCLLEDQASYCKEHARSEHELTQLRPDCGHRRITGSKSHAASLFASWSALGLLGDLVSEVLRQMHRPAFMTFMTQRGVTRF